MSTARKASYQKGAVVRVPRRKGPDVWVFRYYRYHLNGARERISEQFSDLRECPTKAAAEKKADFIRRRINDERQVVLFSNLCDRYIDDGMSIRENTKSSYLSIVKRLRAQWGSSRLDWMALHPQSIEQWMKELESVPREGRKVKPLSLKTRSNIKEVLHRMFKYAMKWGYLEMAVNPIDFVELRGLPASVRKQKEHPTPTTDQYRNLLNDPDLEEHVKVMIQVATMTGMRASEFLGLRWDDVDFKNGLIYIQRSVVGNHQDATKTPESEARYPMHDALAAVFAQWRKSSVVIEGWVFGSALTGRPFWRGSLQRDHLVPAGKRMGIPNLGWHGFRHAYRALQSELELPVEMQMRLMRHTRITTTMRYGKNSPERTRTLRQANAKVIEMLPTAATGL